MLKAQLQSPQRLELLKLLHSLSELECHHSRLSTSIWVLASSSRMFPTKYSSKPSQTQAEPCQSTLPTLDFKTPKTTFLFRISHPLTEAKDISLSFLLHLSQHLFLKFRVRLSELQYLSPKYKLLLMWISSSQIWTVFWRTARALMWQLSQMRKCHTWLLTSFKSRTRSRFSILNSSSSTLDQRDKSLFQLHLSMSSTVVFWL